ncbi:MAG: 30S ribosomal protein S2 [Actinobacteria bacterium]|nr:30S ribosomal protein S2 [Actinomycetota bacterium]
MGVSMRQLLDSGVHFGHQTRRWNPKMRRFIFTERNGIYIIDLQQSLTFINTAYDVVKESVARGGTVLFVGTKKQAQETIAEQANRVGMPYVNQRWLGGMLTNFGTISKRLTRLKELEVLDFDSPSNSGMTKKELLILKREKNKLELALGGLRGMTRAPSLVWVIDTNKEANAVKEARKLGIPVVAVLDTNCDPDVVDFPIPGNDDALRSVALLTRVIADAVAEGLVARTARTVGNEDTAEAALKAWEAELAAEMEAKAVADAPVADAPVADAPVADAPAADAPAADAPAADAPAEVAAGDAPVADAPAEVVAADAPVADAPAEVAAADAPAADADTQTPDETA